MTACKRPVANDTQRDVSNELDFYECCAVGERVVSDGLQTGQVAEREGLNTSAPTEGISINDP